MKHHDVEILARGVCVKDGKLLVCHTKGADNTYLPGGHVEFGESAKHALKREIEEEMGAKAKIGAFLGAVEHKFKQKGRTHCEVNLVFLANIPSLSPERKPVSKEDYIEFLWCRLEDMNKSELEPEPLRSCLVSWLTSTSTNRWATTF